MDDTLVEIVKLCKSIDGHAKNIYSDMAGRATDKGLERFWEEMSEQEGWHLAHWDSILRLAAQESTPRVFDRPEEVQKELQEILSKVEGLADRRMSPPSVSGDFSLALSLEFFLLHPAFSSLLKLLKDTYLDEDPVAEYEAHIEGLIQALREYDAIPPELSLLGDTIRRLWKQNLQLQIQSHLDPLTGVLNRRGFYEMALPLIMLAKRNKRPVGLFMVDVDEFKQINDGYGHQRGDEVLVSVADALKSNIRGSDITAKYGGDEFLVFLSEVDPPSMSSIGEKLRKAVEYAAGQKFPATISVGGSSTTIRGDIHEELDTLINAADTCLLEAKRDGKNRVVVKD